MARRAPNKTAVRIMIPTELIERIDKAVELGVYNSRNDLIMHLIRNHLDKVESLEQSQHEYKYKLWEQKQSGKKK